MYSGTCGFRLRTEYVRALEIPPGASIQIGQQGGEGLLRAAHEPCGDCQIDLPAVIPLEDYHTVGRGLGFGE